MKSLVCKRSIAISGYKTSISLEDAFWNALKEIAEARNTRVSELVAAINSERQHDNLSSTLRVFVLEFYRKQLSEEEGRITEGSTAPNWERARDRSPPARADVDPRPFFPNARSG